MATVKSDLSISCPGQSQDFKKDKNKINLFHIIVFKHSLVFFRYIERGCFLK